MWRRWWLWGVGGSLGLVLLTYLVLGAGLWFSDSPLAKTYARWPLWPIACTSGGCVTTADWYHYARVASAFAQWGDQEVPASHEMLTTAVKALLAQEATTPSPVSMEDARRYRQEILGISDDHELFTTVLQPVEYDRFIVQPFLLQTYLLDQRQAEDAGDLYRILETERPVILLSTSYRWDALQAEVVPR